ncbi:proteasome-type protease [Rubellimicrobium aerolatum]|uniref:Proteasome-type protease n=1 Tax=Rubellimicrobium aerolatum TaxID=490979 RepID=A0ABW0SC26_9RHOB|nr:proteasome-type protease [Rubellimicrobium aerolatum]MBP1806010.1 putative proteasome-type protease [Rubellimicrobium aerolatum]
MTYCVALRLSRGLVFMSDTRTNAGLDNISTYRKMFTWADEGETVITIMTAGNLATTQSVVSMIDERNRAPSERHPAILQLPSMFQVARYIGNILKEVIAQHADTGDRADSYFNASIIVGGQVKGSAPRLFLIYPEGNFIEAGEDTPFLQIGEFKYGRPILVRAFDAEMSFEAAVKLLLVSFDSTIKANLSVGLPLDLQMYERDSLRRGLSRRIKGNDAYFQTISHGWGDALKQAFDSLPDLVF